MIKFSDDQMRAASIIDKNVCVNAGAGSGKTEVVSYRFKKMHDSGIDLSKIVCITFTNKASQEMKERIISYIDDDDLVDDINVSTISSFCKKVISDNSYYLNIDPNFSVISEDEPEIMVKSIISDLIFERKDQVNDLGKGLDLKSEDLKDFIYQSYSKLKTFYVDIENLKKDTLEKIRGAKTYKLDEIISRIMSYEDQAQTLGLKANSKLFKFFKNLSDLIEKDDKEGLLEVIYAYKKDDLGTSKDLDKLDFMEEVNDFFLKVLLGYEKDYAKNYEDYFDLIMDLDSLYSLKKRERGVLDFNDLEFYANKLLENPQILRAEQEKYHYFMIDEYQDTSDIQKEIFYKLCSREETLDRNNLFVVGDPKQAIYSFRGANIKIFKKTQEDIVKSGGEYITFVENFRTHPNIMNPINDIYRLKMGGRYDELIARKDPSCLIEETKYVTGKKADESNDKDHSCLEFVSNINSENYMDYAILGRKRSDLNKYEAYLNQKNIPYYLFDKKNLEGCREVLDIINYLKYSVYGDEISLTGVLTSNFYGLSYKDILEKNQTFKKAKKDLDYFSKLVFDLSKSKGIRIAMTRLIDRYDYLEKLGQEGAIQGQANIFKLLELAFAFDEKRKGIEFFIDYFDSAKGLDQMQYEDETSPLVKLMTIHKSKGLGFTSVHIDNLSKGEKAYIEKYVLYTGENSNPEFALKFKRSPVRYRRLVEKNKNDEAYENDNIYYTAMTRAKDKLSFMSSTGKSGYYKNIADSVESLKNSTSPLSGESISYRIVDMNYGDMQRAYLDQADSQIISFKDVNFDKPNTYINTSITEILDQGNEDVEKVEKQAYRKSDVNSLFVGNLIHNYAYLYDGENEVVINELNSLNEKERELCQRSIKNLKSLINFDCDYRAEMGFTYIYDKLKFTGAIDRIEIYDDHIKLYDYKISSRSKESLKRKYKRQVDFYAYIISKSTDKPIEVNLANLNKNYVVKYIYSDDDKREVIKMLDDYLKEKTDKEI
ncbi:MAG: UvrD-helicase domain-containing protein [Finegoldia sp.]|nr:UvrD-helicase domain-containing protein [Finegoldia sp.]